LRHPFIQLAISRGEIQVESLHILLRRTKGKKSRENDPDENPRSKPEKGPEESGGDRHVQFWELLFQIATAILFALFLGLTILFYQERQQTFFLVCFLLAWTSAGGAIAIWINHNIILEPNLSGWLIPANDPLPEHHCPDIPADAIIIFYGGSVAYTTAFPFTALRIGEEEFITIKKVKDALSISTKVYSKDHRIVAEIVDNEFHINPNNYFRKTRPDKYTLLVYDQQRRIILNIRYMNTRAIKLLGIFNSPGRPEVVIREKEIRVGRLHLGSDCIGNFRNGYVIN
jgi:hypothetical protein